MMDSRWPAALIVAVAVTASASAQAAPNVQRLAMPGAGTVTIYQPEGSPQQVVLFLSGDGGWNLGVVGMADRLRRAGALVVGIDIRALVRTMESSRNCAYPAGILEDLSRAVQLRVKLPTYHRPILVGYSSGATLAYATFAAAPPETFAGAISLGFCPDIDLNRPLCPMRGLVSIRHTKSTHYLLPPFKGSSVPWMVLQGERDQVCAPGVTNAFVRETGSARVFMLPKVGHGFSVTANWEPAYLEAYRTIANARGAEARSQATAPDVADLSLVEVPASARAAGDAMVILLTGDGGWAEIDKTLAAGLSTHGIPVVAWSSLSYYWTPRTPERAAADLTRIIEHYSGRWRRSRVFVVGYSFGASVAPFLVNRLPEAERSRVVGLTLLGPSSTASFAFHLSDWLGGSGDARYPTRAEVERTSAPVSCVFAGDELDSVCRQIKAPNVRLASVGSGHHFGGHYGQLVDLILRQVTPASASDGW